MITHKPTDGKLRTIPSSAGPVPMRFNAKAKAWVGEVKGKTLKVSPGPEEDHVEAMRTAIEKALATKAKK